MATGLQASTLPVWMPVTVSYSFWLSSLILRFGPHLIGELVAQCGDVDTLVIRKGFFRFRALLVGLGVIDGKL